MLGVSTSKATNEADISLRNDRNMSGLFVISRTSSAPNGAPQNPAQAGLEEEIKRVEAEIDKIFAETGP
jgi:hypothetical protein